MWTSFVRPVFVMGTIGLAESRMCDTCVHIHTHTYTRVSNMGGAGIVSRMLILPQAWRLGVGSPDYARALLCIPDYIYFRRVYAGETLVYWPG